LYKQIEAQCISSASVVCLVQQGDEALRQTIAKRNQGFVEFGKGYTTALVGVEAVKKAAPRGEKAP
jgi:hypothetical protein